MEWAVTQRTTATKLNIKKERNSMKPRHSGEIETLKNAIVAAINGTGLKGAGKASSTALKTVPKAFTKSIHGVLVVAKEPEPAWLSNN
jgi:hypothetical protein